MGLPPSPSPRNNITSPQPQQNQQPVVEQFQAIFPNITPSIPPPPATVIAPPASSLQHHPQTQTDAATTADVPNNASGKLQAKTTAATVAAAPEMLNSLFESSVYPDPFSESSPTPQQQQTAETVGTSDIEARKNSATASDMNSLDSATITTVTATTSIAAAGGSNASGIGAAAGGGDNAIAQLLSPPKSTHNSNASGHRRNVSDTSAFNK